MMILEEKFKLSNGITIPKLGLGTWFINNNDITQAVKDAASLGYRHIDTARAYGNESGVGEGIRTCGIRREEMFVTTKLAAEVKSYKEAVSSIDTSLKTMGLDYIDMMIIHSPKPWAKFLEQEPFFKGNVKRGEHLKKRIMLENFELLDFQTLKRQTLITSSHPVLLNQWSIRFWLISARHH